VRSGEALGRANGQTLGRIPKLRSSGDGLFVIVH
jgi:hypothetical protein